MKYAVFLICFFILFKIIHRITSKKLTERYIGLTLREDARTDENLPVSLLTASMPKRCLFTSLSLPIPGKEGEEIHLGSVAVNRYGVFIICQINGAGLVENVPEAKWKFFSGGKYAEFDNPFRAQEGARNLIEYYSKKAGIPGVKAHSIITYTDPDLRFSEPLCRLVIPIAALPARLGSLDRIGRLTHRQVKDLCGVLKEINDGLCLY